MKQRRMIPGVAELESRALCDGADDGGLDPGTYAALQGSSYTGGSWADDSATAQGIIDQYTWKIMTGTDPSELAPGWSVVDDAIPEGPSQIPAGDPYN